MTVLRTYQIEETDSRKGKQLTEIYAVRLHPGGNVSGERVYKCSTPLRASRFAAIAEVVKRGYLLDCHNLESRRASYTFTTYGVPKESTDRKRLRELARLTDWMLQGWPVEEYEELTKGRE